MHRARHRLPLLRAEQPDALRRTHGLLGHDGVEVVESARLRTILSFALKVNHDSAGISDTDTDDLRAAGLTDKGIVQLVHLVSDFASYNRLNIALDTDYDYRDMWRAVAFGWTQQPGEVGGDNTRGLRQ